MQIHGCSAWSKAQRNPNRVCSESAEREGLNGVCYKPNKFREPATQKWGNKDLGTLLIFQRYQHLSPLLCPLSTATQEPQDARLLPHLPFQGDAST